MANEEQPKACNCPNCLSPALRTGNEITCEICDAVFTITKKQGAKVKTLGPIDDHERRISALEGKQGPQEPEPKSTQEPEPEEEDL